MNSILRNLILCVGISIATSASGQEAFSIKEDGLNPKFLTSQIVHLTKSELHKEILTWIEENQKLYKLSVVGKTENEVIHFSSIKGNAVNLNDSYYHAKYDIIIRFVDGQYQFEPTKIQLKINSKYDMGWKDFDHTDGAMYFKKGKVIRKYKSYLEDITAPLNELNIHLSTYLKE